MLRGSAHMVGTRPLRTLVTVALIALFPSPVGAQTALEIIEVMGLARLPRFRFHG